MFCAEQPSLGRRTQVGTNDGCSADEDGTHEGGRVPWGDEAGCAGQSKGFVVCLIWVRCIGYGGSAINYVFADQTKHNFKNNLKQNQGN